VQLHTVENPYYYHCAFHASYVADAACVKKPAPTPTTPTPTITQHDPASSSDSPTTQPPTLPATLMHELNGKLEALDHKMKLSAVRRTPKGNLVATADPNTMSEALWAASSAMQSVFSPPGRPASVHRDVKWSKVMLHGVFTGKDAQNEAFAPNQIHEEVATHDPV
jgi:hypothetical protein